MIYKDYATIVQVAKKYYKDDNYCTVVALAVAAGIGYGAAFHTYRRLGRVAKKGTRLEMQKAATATKYSAVPVRCLSCVHYATTDHPSAWDLRCRVEW